MPMPVEKAKKVLRRYKENNYDAKQTLTDVGYSSTTATKQAARTIDVAVNTLARANERDALLEFAGLTKEDLAKEYKSVIEQNKNYPAKLRAMEPLLKMQGITWNEEKNTTTVPILNVTVSKNDTAQQSDEKNVAQYALSDTNTTAQQSHSIDENK